MYGAWDNKVPDKMADETPRRGVTGAVINTNCKHLIRQHLVALIPRRVARGRSKILIEQRKIDAAGW